MKFHIHALYDERLSRNLICRDNKMHCFSLYCFVHLYITIRYYLWLVLDLYAPCNRVEKSEYLNKS